VRLTAKERVLLHLLDFARHAESVEVPPEMAQEGVAGAVGIELRHLTQYIRPLEAEGLVRERRAHISGARQRRIVYDLTDTGRRAAMRLRDAVKSEVVRVRDAGGVREVTVARLLEESKGSASVVFISRQVAEAGIVELGALSRPGAPGLVEMLSDAPRIAKFVGREVELAAVTGTADGPRVFVVRGVAGIGKSSFAARACDLLRGRCNLFWHRLRPWDSRPSILARLGEFLSALGKPGLRSVLARGETARADPVLREDLPGTKSLLVFDDAHESAPEVLSFFRFLKDVVAGASDVRVLVLTRRAVPFYDRRDTSISGLVREIDLAGFRSEEIAAFLSADPASRWVADLAGQLGGHPLFLELLRSGPPPAAGGTALRDVRRFIEEEIYGELSEAERRVMKTASLYRVPVPREALLPDAALSHDVLLSLRDRSLIRPVGEDRFGLHDTIREFFGGVLTPGERKELAPFAVHQLRGLAEGARRAGNFVATIDDLTNALQLETSPDERRSLSEALGDAHERIGDLPGTLSAYGVALAIAEDPEVVARLHRKTAAALQVRGELAPAIAELEAGFHELGNLPSEERGWLELVRCRVVTRREEWKEARESGDAALRTFRSLGHRPGQAQALLELGNIEVNSQTSDPKVAEGYLTAALGLSEGVGDPEFTARVHIALAHLFANRFGDVERTMKSIASIETLLPSVADPHIRRSFLMLRGWFNLELLAEYAEAERFFTEAIALAERIYDPPTAAFARYGVASVRYFQGAVDEARREYERFSVDIDALGFPGYGVEGMWMVAECSLRLGDLPRFHDVASALEDPKFARGVEARPIHIRVLRGIDRLARGDFDGSRAAFEEALRFAGRGFAVDETSLEHFAHSFYGFALLAMGREREGDAHIRLSVEFLERYGQKARLSVFSEMRERVVPALRAAASAG